MIGRWAIEVADLDLKEFMREFLALYTGPWLTSQLRQRFPFASPAELEDVRQEVCLRTLRIPLDKREGVKSVQAYVFKMLENLKVDQVRRIAKDKRIKHMGSLSDLARLSSSWLIEVITPEEEELQALSNRVMLEADIQVVAALPPKCRQAWELFGKQELLRTEIARIMGITVSTVTNHLNKAARLIGKKRQQAVAALLERRKHEP